MNSPLLPRRSGRWRHGVQPSSSQLRRANSSSAKAAVSSCPTTVPMAAVGIENSLSAMSCEGFSSPLVPLTSAVMRSNQPSRKVVRSSWLKRCTYCAIASRKQALRLLPILRASWSSCCSGRSTAVWLVLGHPYGLLNSAPTNCSTRSTTATGAVEISSAWRLCQSRLRS